MQFALSATAGVALVALPIVIQLVRKGRTPTGADIYVGVPAAACFATIVYDMIHQGGLPRMGRLIREGAMVAFLAASLIAWGRMLWTFWHDEDELIEQLGSNEGYIPRRRRIPVRVQAVLLMLLLAGLLALLAATYIQTLFASE